MANDDKPLKGRVGEPTRGKTKTKLATAERPFDVWLQKQLHAMYDEIAGEPLPEDLLALIDQDKSTERGPGSPNKK